MQPLVGRLKLVGAVLALMAVFGAIVPDASAHFWNHYWAKTRGTYLNLYYARDCASSFWQFTDTAARNWSYNGTWLRLYNTRSLDCNGGVHDGYIDVYAMTSSTTGPGYAQNFTVLCDTSNRCWWDFLTPYTERGRIRASRVFLNQRSYDTASYKQFLATHELGHSFGLAHNGAYARATGESTQAGENYSIMDYHKYFNTPQAHDRQDVNYLYP
jgi:hypothetical protein